MKTARFDIEFRYGAFIIFILVFLMVLGWGSYIEKQKSKPVVAVLMFHSVNNGGPAAEDEAGVVITPERFSKHISYLKGKGYEFIHSEQLSELLGSSPQNPEAGRKILLTFDDGYRDNYTNAYPVLKREKVKALINIVVYYTEPLEKDSHVAERYLSWDHIKEMHESGIIQVGSHSYRSHAYVQLEKKRGPALAGRKRINGVLETPQAFRERVKDDLEKSFRIIKKRTGESPAVIAFPYGSAAPEAKEIACELGFKVQMGIKPGVNVSASDLQDLKRINVRQRYTERQLEEKIRFYIGARRLLP